MVNAAFQGALFPRCDSDDMVGGTQVRGSRRCGDMVAEMRIVVPYDNGQKGFLRFHQNGSGFDGTVPGNMPGRGNNGIR